MPPEHRLLPPAWDTHPGVQGPHKGHECPRSPQHRTRRKAATEIQTLPPLCNVLPRQLLPGLRQPGATRVQWLQQGMPPAVGFCPLLH